MIYFKHAMTILGIIFIFRKYFIFSLVQFTILRILRHDTELLLWFANGNVLLKYEAFIGQNTILFVSCSDE